MKAVRPTVAAVLLAAVGLAVALPAQSSIETRDETLAQPRAWSAMAGTDTNAIMAMAQDFASGDRAAADAPYCDSNAVMRQTLVHDFGESLVDDAKVGSADTQLWGSDMMGTWTLVMTRADNTSCVVASGVGYTDRTDPDVFYGKAGITG